VGNQFIIDGAARTGRSSRCRPTPRRGSGAYGQYLRPRDPAPALSTTRIGSCGPWRRIISGDALAVRYLATPAPLPQAHRCSWQKEIQPPSRRSLSLLSAAAEYKEIKWSRSEGSGPDGRRLGDLRAAVVLGAAVAIIFERFFALKRETRHSGPCAPRHGGWARTSPLWRRSSSAIRCAAARILKTAPHALLAPWPEGVEDLLIPARRSPRRRGREGPARRARSASTRALRRPVRNVLASSAPSRPLV